MMDSRPTFFVPKVSSEKWEECFAGLARAIGQSIKEYRQERLNEAFEAEAERLGFFAWELTLQLTSASPQEFEAQRLEVHREVAQMAGTEWVEYCELHGPLRSS